MGMQHVAPAHRAWAWACPNCGINHTGEYEGIKTPCERQSADGCAGFLCECDSVDQDTPLHGYTPATACLHAVCHHCLWGGVWPPQPVKTLPWEKEALAAGWKPPAYWGGSA